MREDGAGRIRVLHVDEPDSGGSLPEFLESERRPIAVTTETSVRDALDRLGEGGIDCILSGYETAGMDGIEFLRTVRERYPDLPFVLATDRGSEEVASEAIAAGVTEYLPVEPTAERYALLTDRIERAVDKRCDRGTFDDSERMLSTLIANLPGMVYRCRNEPGWPMEFVSTGCEDLTGYPPTALESGDVSWGEEIIHPDDREKTWTAVQTAVNSGEPFVVTYRIRTRDGDLRWVWERGSGVFESGDLVGLEGFITDITERKRRKRELERFETIVQAVGDPVYALDADGQFTFVNDAMEEMTGYAAEELVGEHIRTIVSDQNITEGREYIGDLVKDEDRRAVKYEIEVITRAGERIPSELHLALLPTDGDEFRGTAGIIRDIEERKEREKRLEEFTSVVSHDLRGPLNVVLGQAQLAMESPDSASIEDIFRSARRMEDLIDDLLALALQGETIGERTEVSLAAVVEDAWRGIETGETALDNAAGGRLQADRDRLQELLENLIGNAVEHGGPGVTVSVGILDGREGFYVADDGTGIPPEERENVFEHGYTTCAEGTGFGLAIVKRIAEAHGWSVSLAESDAGGARFEFAVE